MTTKSQIDNFQARSSKDLCKLAEMLGYGKGFGQLQCDNGAFVSSLLEFFDDNPGAMEAVVEFVADNVETYVRAGVVDDDSEDDDSEEAAEYEGRHEDVV